VLKQLGILDTAASLKSRSTRNTATETATGVTAAEDDNANKSMERETLPVRAPLTVSVVSKEQAVQLLKQPGHEQTTKRSKSKGATATMTTPTQEAGNSGNAKSSAKAAEAGAVDSPLEGKFVNLVDLLLPVPIKGEFDVNKIKKSLYFFS
jgi:DNA-directed RNA polymerase